MVKACQVWLLQERACELCNQQAKALSAIEESFSTAQMLSPSPGFSQRWQVRLSEYQEQRQKRRMWLLTISLLGLATLILIGLFLVHQSHFNWIYSFSQFIANFSLFAARINQLWRVMKAITTVLPILLPIMLIFSIGILSAMAVLVIAWFNSIIKLYQPVEEGVV